MLLSFTLDTNADGQAQARQALSLIAQAFNIPAHVPETYSDAQAAAHAHISSDDALDASQIFAQPGTVQGAVSTTPEGYTLDLSKVDVDKFGLPWDARIHAGTRTKNAGGEWKKKKGVDEATVARVESELRNIMTIPAPAGSVAPATEATAVPPPPPAATAAAVTAPPPPPAAGGAGDVMTFAKLMGWLGPHMASGRLTAEVVSETVKGAGIVDGAGNGSLVLLAARPDLVPQVYNSLTALVV